MLVDDREEAADWSAPLAGVQRELISAHLLLLSRLLRRSAMVDYAGLDPGNLMERRIIFTLSRIGEGRVSELSALLGNDIAQVSRALSTMKRKELAERQRQRDPYSLTDAGRELGRLMDKVAVRRERELAHGMEPLQMFELAGMLDNLRDKAAVLLAEEMAGAREAEDADAEGPPRTEIASRLQPSIAALATTILRSATLAFKRLTGLSQYEWRILANLAYRPSIPFMDLVTHIGSDKAQVSRALNPLIEAGLLRRISGERGEPALLEMTEKGWDIHGVMQRDALRRNAVLGAGFTQTQRLRLKSYLELLIVNATTMARRAD